MTENGCAERPLIVGAGLAGLMAARELRRAGRSPLVLEKSAGLGGRLATRRIRDGVFDHGAQFITGRDPQFLRLLEDWQSAGVVREWCYGFPAGDGPRLADGHPRFKVVGGMTALAKHLARDIDIRTDTRVVRLEIQNDHWRLHAESGEQFRGTALVLTPPVPQIRELLATVALALSGTQQQFLESAVYDSCIVLLAVLARASLIPEPGGLRFSEGPLAFLTDNHLKGISPRPGSVTLQSTAVFARDHWEDTDESLVRLLSDAAREWVDIGIATEVQIKRWRYSSPLTLYSKPCLRLLDAPALVLAGDAYGVPRIEGAALSGVAAAQAVSQ